MTEEAVLSSFLSNDGVHLVLLAVSSAEVLTLFQSDYEAQNEGKLEILAAVAGTFEDALASLMTHARKIYEAQAGDMKPKASDERDKAMRKVESQRLERWYDSLGFCTWNGIGQDLNEQKLLTGLDTLSRHNIRLFTLIIDDNWQSLDFKGDSHFDYR